MKTMCFHSLLIMILMLGVFMMVTNASNEPKDDPKPTDKEKMNESSERPILKSKFQQNRLLQVCAFKTAFDFPLDITKNIFSYLTFAPGTTKLFPHTVAGGMTSRDGHFFLSYESPHHNLLYLSDLTSGERVRTFTAPDLFNKFYSCAIANNRAFVVGGCHSKIYLWNTFSGKLMTTLVGHNWYATFCCIFFNDTRIATGSYSEVRVCEVETPQYSCLYVIQVDDLHNLLVSADHARIITTSARNTKIQVWNSATGQCLQVLEGHAHSPRYKSCAISDDDDHCLGSVDNVSGETKLWNTITGECTKTIPFLHDDHGQSLFRICYLSSKRVVWQKFGEVRVWDLQKETTIHHYDLHLCCGDASMSIDGKYLIVSRTRHEELTLYYYSLETGKLIE